MAGEKHTKKKVKVTHFFRFFMFLWIIALVIFGFYANNYVKATLVEMQENTPSEIVTKALDKITDDQIRSLFNFTDKVDEGDQVANIRKIFTERQYVIKKESGSDSYGIFKGDQQLATVVLNKLRSVSKIGVINYGIYELVGIEPCGEKELYHLEVHAPSYCQIYMSGQLMTPDSSESPTIFGDAYNYVEIPSDDTYIFRYLTKEPELKVMRGEEEVPYDIDEEGVVTIASSVEHFDSLEAAGCDFDILGFAEVWSKFMTDDLKGTRHGFNTVAAYLIEGSTQYSDAWGWATKVDITFVSGHTLGNPPFPEESISNIIKYGDDLISADVHLVKHMRITRTGANHYDTMDSTICLVRYGGEWKVINIRGIKK